MTTRAAHPPRGEPSSAWRAWHRDSGPIRLGVSACLLGEEVRYDGGHKRERFLVEELGPWVEWVSVCPEVELGMGIPRPSVRLVASRGGERMLCPETGEDFTARMRAHARERVRELGKLGLDGYVLKSRSPSCGLARVKVHRSIAGGVERRDGVGLFARELKRAWPELPIEDEARLADPARRENFFERLFCRNRWRALVRRGLTRRRLTSFWSAHELLVRAHDEAGCRRIDRLLGPSRRHSDRELLRRFEHEFFTALRARATPRRHGIVLRHAVRLLRGVLDDGERRRLLAAVEDYLAGRLLLDAPLSLLRSSIREHQIVALQGQLYFDPHPGQAILRGRV